MNALLAGIFLMASPLHAQPGGNCAIIDCPTNFMPSPGGPSIAGRQKVATALIAVEDAEKNEAAASRSLKTSMDAVRSNLEKPYYRLPRWAIDRLVTEEKVQTAALSDRDYLLKQEALRTAIAENYKAHNAAILAAATEYQLFPPIMDFTGDPRAPGVNLVAKPWLPHYSRHEKRDKDTGLWRKRNANELAQEQADNAIVGGGVMGAQTRGNGVMEFYGQAFASPEDLAILIYHETSHWVDIAARSGGFKYSDPPEVSFRTEQHAYERAAVFAAKLGVNPQPHLNRAAQFKLQADQAQRENLRWDQVPVRHPNWIGKERQILAMGPAEQELSAGDEALLQKKMAQAQSETREARKNQEMMEELRRRLATLPPPADLHPTRPDGLPFDYVDPKPTVPGAGGPAALRPAKPPLWPMLLKDIAAGACASPPKPVDRALAAMDWRVFQAEPNAGRVADGLSACERRVIFRLIELGRAWRPGVVIDAAAVRAAAADPDSGTAPGGGRVPSSPNHDPVWGKIGPIIGR